jgi:hypothetical protein
MALQQCARGVDARRGNLHRRTGAPVYQQWLVTDLVGCGVRVTAMQSCAAAVSARNDARVAGPWTADGHQRDDQRGLAAATGHDIADHDHGHRQVLHREQAAAVKPAPHVPHTAGTAGTAATTTRPAGRVAARHRAGSAAALRRPWLLTRCGFAEGWVAKVIWASPARRAASMTVMTAWCLALASALDDDDGVLAGFGCRQHGIGQDIRALRPTSGTAFTE